LGSGCIYTLTWCNTPEYLDVCCRTFLLPASRVFK